MYFKIYTETSTSELCPSPLRLSISIAIADGTETHSTLQDVQDTSLNHTLVNILECSKLMLLYCSISPRVL